MYAIIEDSGTQIKVAEGEEIEVDIRDVGDSKSLSFDRVLLVGDAGSEADATVGAPYIDGASVEAEILGEFKDRKIDVVKFKRRKGYRRKTGHRQRYLRVKITGIKS